MLPKHCFADMKVSENIAVTQYTRYGIDNVKENSFTFELTILMSVNQLTMYILYDKYTKNILYIKY
jgi:hypothetical protein